MHVRNIGGTDGYFRRSVKYNIGVSSVIKFICVHFEHIFSLQHLRKKSPLLEAL